MIKSIARAGNMGLRLVTGLLAAFLLIYGLLSLWGMSRAGYRAFSSHDLLKYRPKIEMNEPPDLHEIMEVNPDTVAWITLYGTNIDYPVMPMVTTPSQAPSFCHPLTPVIFQNLTN